MEDEEVQDIYNTYVDGDDKGYRANEKYLFYKLVNKMKSQRNPDIPEIISDNKEVDGELIPVDKISLANLDSECVNDNEDNIKADLKSLMKMVVQDLKPNVPSDKSEHVSKEQCLECNFK